MISHFLGRWVGIYDHARAAFEDGVFFSEGSLSFFNGLMVTEFLNGIRNMCCLG